MKGNFHVQFLGEGVAATSPPYPTPGWATTPVYPARISAGFPTPDFPLPGFPASRFHHAGHSSPPFGHAAIVAWAARRGSPDAHELNTIRRAKRAWSSRKKPLSQATKGLLWKE